MAGLNAYQSKLYMSANGVSWTKMNYVRDITTPEITPNMSDVTHLESPNFMREKEQSWADPGAAGFVFLFTHGQYATMKSIREARALYYWKMEFPVEENETTPSTMIWQGKVNGLTVQNTKVTDDPILVEIKFVTRNGYSFTEGS